MLSLKNINSVYFIGIGGVSMSSLAHILLEKGASVYGYDMNRSEVTEALSASGAKITYELSSELPERLDAVVFTAAIKDDNPLLVKARSSGAAVLSRAQLLGLIEGDYRIAIGVAGTHGKSTTTGFISSVCLYDDENTAVLSGANLPFLGSSFKTGNGDKIVYEACEYKDSYLSMIPTVKVILNCEHDHIDYFPTLEDVKRSFGKYAGNSRNGNDTNITVVNLDSPNAVDAVKDSGSEIYYYSDTRQADFYAERVEMKDGYGHFSLAVKGKGTVVEDIRLNIPGRHNVSNAVAAFAACCLAGVSPENIRKGLERFTGVSRRFELLGSFNGARVFDDYAHHPDEIRVTLTAAKDIVKGGRIFCVFQPHTYSRTVGFLDDFASALSLADKVYLCDIFPAREVNVWGVSSGDIAKKMDCAEYIDSFDAVTERLKAELRADDICITMGAGVAYKVAEALLRNKD